MIQYSHRAYKAIAQLFRPYNDIDIYVEDELTVNMYEILVSRILEDKARVKKVFSLKGKHEVIKACGEDQDDNTRPRIYIIDGDIDLLLNIAPPNLKNLYRLNVYTSENLLISEKAIIEVAYENLIKETKKNVKTIINFNEALSDCVEKLKPAFVMYAVKHSLENKDKKQIHIKTTGYTVTNMCKESGDCLRVDEDKVNEIVREIKEKLQNDYGYTEEQVTNTIKEIESKLPSTIIETAKYISGKTYLLPLLYQILKRRTKHSGTMEQLKPRLARHCELDIDPNFRQALINACKS